MRQLPANSPRRRAKQGRSAETVEVILSAAAQVLLREGYARATTNRIAERAGVSVGSIYQYFQHKDDVFDALIQRQVRELLTRLLAEPPDPTQPLEDTLRHLISVAMRAQTYGPELVRHLEYVPNALLRRRLAEPKRHLTDFIKALLAVHRARLRVSDLDLAAFVILSAVEGIGRDATAAVFDERLAAEVTDLLARYLIASA